MKAEKEFENCLKEIERCEFVQKLKTVLVVFVILTLMIASYGFGRLQYQKETLENNNIEFKQLLEASELSCKIGCKIASSSVEKTQSCLLECEKLFFSIYRATILNQVSRS